MIDRIKITDQSTRTTDGSAKQILQIALSDLKRLMRLYQCGNCDKHRNQIPEEAFLHRRHISG